MGTLESAFAHIVLTEPKAVAGSYYKATLRVGHGCNGSATTGLTVQVPAGFQGAKPQPKAGWVIATRKSKLATPYNSHGKTVTEDVVELQGHGGPVVLADRWDNPGGGVAGDSTFLVHALLEHPAVPAAAGALWDPDAVRTCLEAGPGARLQLRVSDEKPAAGIVVLPCCAW